MLEIRNRHFDSLNRDTNIWIVFARSALFGRTPGDWAPFNPPFHFIQFLVKDIHAFISLWISKLVSMSNVIGEYDHFPYHQMLQKRCKQMRHSRHKMKPLALCCVCGKCRRCKTSIVWRPTWLMLSNDTHLQLCIACIGDQMILS